MYCWFACSELQEIMDNLDNELQPDPEREISMGDIPIKKITK